MNPSSEYEGKTIDDAIGKACSALKVSKTSLKYDVISHGSTGIFGLVGTKKARIRVNTPAPAPKTGPAPSKNKGKGGTSAASAATERPATPESAAKESAAQAESVAAAPKSAPPETESPSTESSAGTARIESPPSDASDIISSEGIKQKADSLVEAIFDPPSERDASTLKPEAAPAAPDANLEAAVEAGRSALTHILNYLTEDTQIELTTSANRVLFKVAGGQSGLLIGKRGQTLEAIQYLVEKVVNKLTKENVRVQIDVEGYLETRKSSLEQLAARLAEKTRRTGKPTTIGQMNAHDRRIVHIALKDNKAVRTQSVGEGDYRKLMIFPKQSTTRRGSRGGKKPAASPTPSN